MGAGAAKQLDPNELRGVEERVDANTMMKAV